MSSLSFARIMYGASQEQPSYAVQPFSNASSKSFTSPDSARPESSSAGSNQSFLHKAWRALTRHN